MFSPNPYLVRAELLPQVLHGDLEHVRKVVDERGVGGAGLAALHVEEVLGHVGRGDGEAVPRARVRPDALGSRSVLT